MRLIKPYFEIIEQQPGEVGMLKHIETCGRVAWKSEDKITDDSYIKFVDMIKSVKHGSVLEHGTIYLKQHTDFRNQINNDYLLRNRYSKNKYSKYIDKGIVHYVTTNYRVLVENNWLDDLQYQCEPTEHHEKRITVKFTCDRGVSHKKFVA